MIVRIKSKRDGYRRCGIKHPRLATDHPSERFTEGMLEKLQADPVLVVELVDGELPAASPEGGQSGGAGDSGTDSPATNTAAAKPVKPPRGGGGSAKSAAKPAAAKKPAAKKSAAPKAANPAAKTADPVDGAGTTGAQEEQPGEKKDGEA